jgi:hypothetical protein
MPFDQLHCRRVRDDVPKRRVRAELVARDPVFGSATGCILKLPARYLCDGSALTSTDPEMPGAAAGGEAQRYLCYRARCDDGGETARTLHDPFGERAVEVKGSRLVCAPAHLVGDGSTTSTTMASDTTSTTMAPETTTSTTMAPAPTTSTTSTTMAPPSTTSTTSVPSSTTTTTTLGGPQPPSSGCPVVNEVMTGGATSASEEFVELVNPCGHALDLAGARLLYRSATGGTERVLASWDAGRVLAAGGRLVYATSLFPGASDGIFVAGLAATGGGVAVVDATGALIDAVGWGTAANGFVEGSVAPAPAAGSVVARIPDGTDTDDGASDWEQASPTPGAAN